jgi:putative IMPACT (imprinted ancient) family translation regulator
MEHYEKQYIEETGDKKPDIKNYGTSYELFKDATSRWYQRYSLWLCKRLEKVEHNESPYSLKDTIKHLCKAADILLHEKDYDGDNWEVLSQVLNCGNAWLNNQE